MESANLHRFQHQLQDQLVGSSSSSSLASPSFYAASSNHVWTPNILLNSGNFSSNGEILRDSRQENESSIIQDLGFPWSHNNANSIHKFSGVEDFHPHSTTYTKDKDLNDMREKLLLKTISSGFDQISGQNQFYSNAQISRGSFSQIYPSINISTLSQSSEQASSSSMDMNLQALDLLTSARFSGSFSHHQATHHDHNLDIFQDSLSFGLDNMRQSTHKPSCSPSQISSPFSNGVTEVKRPSSLIGLQPKASQAAPKKSRLESRASCPPFKVRKEKLGDRIAALQQLVAPFGKTDTASVLMEAIGYIKFLQNQVETLSVPYMKSTRNKTSRSIQGALNKEDGDEESKRDLKSRGLCLVPLSCMSYVTNDSGGGGLWPPPNFGAGT